jgi:hypothetical protein
MSRRSGSLYEKASSAMLLCAIIAAMVPANVDAAVEHSNDDTPMLAGDPATVTENKGEVLKREFADWTKQELGAPKPVARGDKLYEGMQVATGEKSYVQLSWTDVTARAWANSIYSLAPNRRLVYLQNGQMLFCLDKNRKDKREYVLWSNLLQARVRGTTVFFQSDGKKSQIAVLEGYIDVLNKKDRSLVRIYPGVVYEAIDKTAASTQANEDVAPATSTSLTPVTSGQAIPVFETSQTRNAVYAVSNVAYGLPLVNGFDSELPSLGLLTSTLSKLPSELLNLNNVSSTLTTTVSNLLSKSFQILRTPTGLDYAIGPVVGTAIKLPADALSFFPPVGTIGGGALVPNTGLPAVGSIGNLVNTNNLTPSMVNVSNIAQTGGMSGQLQTVQGISAATASTLSGIAGRTASFSAGATGALGGVTGALGGTTGGVLGGVGSTLGNSTTTLLNTGTGLINGVHFP